MTTEVGVAQRMEAALAQAGARFDLTVDQPPAYRGWRGRRIGVPLSRGSDLVWLKVAEQDRVLDIARLWTGPTEAHETLPPEVVRPDLLGIVDWTEGEYYYRAELWDRLGPRSVASTSTYLRADPVLDATWWDQLGVALDAVAVATTSRQAVRRRYLEVAMRRQLPFEVTSPDVAWVPAHADLHWANVTAPEFALVDWERWGAAPPGWDIATLHVFSLLVPRTAAELRHRFAARFATPELVFAELGAISWVLDTDSDEDRDELRAAARTRAVELGAAVRSR